ncbi:MAG: hypothetical protein Q8N81_03110 [bacterium]|nr:hypothetical protein [bacterium]
MCYNIRMFSLGILKNLLPNDARARRGSLIYVAASLLLLAGLIVLFSAWQVLAMAISLAFFVMAFYRPRWIVMFLAVWIPFEPFFLKFVPDEIYVYARYFSEGLIYVLAAIIILRLIFGEKKIKPTPLDLPFVLFLLVLVASVIINAVPGGIALLGIRQIIRFVLFFFVVVYLYPPRDFIRRLTMVMFVMVLLQGIIGITQAVVGTPLDEFLIPSERKFFESIQLTSGITQFWDPGSRVFATMGRYDQLGTFLTFFLLFALALLYERNLRQHHRELWLVLAIGIPTLILTFSRASWFGFLLGFLLIGIWLARDQRVLMGFLIFLGMVFGYLAYSGIVVATLTEASGHQTVAERFFEAFSYERWRGEYFGLGRLYWIVQTPAVVVRAAPLFGVGPGQFGGGAATALGNSRAYDALGLPFGVFGTEGYIDNNWFSLWGEAGTIGFGFYIWMYLALFVTAVKVYAASTDPLTRGLSAGLAGAMVAITLQAFLGSYLEMRTLALYLWLFGAFVVVLGRREKII